MEEIIKLEDIILVLKKSWKLITLITIVCTIVAAIISCFVVKPKYDSTIKLFIGKQAVSSSNNQENEGYDSSEVNMYQNLMGTYAQIITTTNSIGTALKNIGLADSTKNIDSVSKNLTVNPGKNTQILTIKYTSTDKNTIVPIINSITNVFINQSKILIPNGSVHVIESAAEPIYPISPNKPLYIIIGFIIGLILSIGIAFLLEYLDNTVKTSNQLEELLGYPVIGSIPEIKE
ncbi:MAG: YveK family protein [Sarcina sp.]